MLTNDTTLKKIEKNKWWIKKMLKNIMKKKVLYNISKDQSSKIG